MDKYTDLLIRLEKAQCDYPDTHVLIGQTRTAIKSQQATITELRENAITEVRATFESDAIEAWKKANAEQQATITELQAEVRAKDIIISNLVGVALESEYGPYYVDYFYPELLKKKGERR